MTHELKKSVLAISLSAFAVIVAGLLSSGCDTDKKGSVPPPPPPPVVNPNGPRGVVHVWSGAFQVTDRQAYQEFLSDQNVCDFKNFWGVTWGTWNCSNYNAIYVSVHLDRLTLPANGFAQIYSNYGGVYAVLPPSHFNGTFSPIDADTGFELYRRGYDFTYTYNSILRYRVVGLPTDKGPLTLEFYYHDPELGPRLLGTAQITRQPI